MADFKNLELDEVMEWPLIPQVMMLVLMGLVIQAAGSWFYIVPKQEHLLSLTEQEQVLKDTVRIKAHKAARLPQLKAQLDELSERYDYLLQQLPEQKELASLLAAVNELGIRHQLTFARIDWGEKEQQDFFSRLPLNLEFSGDYHNIGLFSQAIAQLPRIIYFEHADWQRQDQNSATLSVKVRAYTYQYQPEMSNEQ